MKSFREQYLECKKNGNLVEIEFICPVNVKQCFCDEAIFVGLVCKKHMKQCMSNLCFDEREGDNNG